MSLRIRLALIFALVAMVTAGAIALMTPAIVDQGFRQAAADGLAGSQDGGLGPGPRQGRGLGRAQQETTLAIVLGAAVAAAGASILGILVAGRLVRPLAQLREAAADVAAGNLTRRSHLAGRGDEIGDLARSFDGMAESLERSDVARRRLFQDAAHELKTPLTVIDATTTAILDGVYHHDDQHLQTIREQSHLLTRLVDDLRTVSLAESGHLPMRRAEVDVAEVVGAVVQGFAPRAELAGVLIEVELIDRHITAYADHERLRQMLAALVDNALRHTPPGGTITLAARRAGGDVCLAVRDSGPGIPVDDLPHVFDRFYRADPSRQRSSGSSGLGLAIVRALADAQGGNVGVENVEPHGACFQLTLPSGLRQGHLTV